MYFGARIRDAQQTPDQTITLRQVNQPKQERATLNTMKMSHAAEELSPFPIRTTARISPKTAHVAQVWRGRINTAKGSCTFKLLTTSTFNSTGIYVCALDF